VSIEAAIRTLRRADLRLFRRISGWRSTPLPALRPTPPTTTERLLPFLSWTANMSKLWIAIAAGLFGFGGRSGKRAAVRGLGSIAVTSAIVNALFKPLVKRKRPDVRRVPAVRRLTRQPLTASFPSGHAASGAAFTLGVAIEKPTAGLLLTPLAAAIGYSRSFVGVHYPGDVAGGWLIGAGTALVTRLVWPSLPSPDEIVKPAPAPRELPAAPSGERATVVYNPRSGSSPAKPTPNELRSLLPQAQIEELGEDGSPEEAGRRAAERAKIVGVCAGDGTLTSVAETAIERDKPLLLVPGGTMNHLAHDLGLRSADDAARALARGRGVAVDYGTANGRPFLNNVSLGLYTTVLESRAALEARVGRWPAQLVAVLRAVRRQRPFEVEIDGKRRAIWMLFVGNGEYHGRGLLPGWRRSLDGGLLDVRIMPVRRPAPRLRAILSVLAAGIGRSGAIERRRAPRLVIDCDRDAIRLTRDGEELHMQVPVVFESHRRGLSVYAERE
jgi:diacylglycerol kinase family enzyme/membrane-associated phospholipid phosphatase